MIQTNAMILPLQKKGDRRILVPGLGSEQEQGSNFMDRQNTVGTPGILQSRREFAAQLGGSVMAFSLIELLWTRNLFAQGIAPVISKWFVELNEMGEDLNGGKLKDIAFQAKMEDLYRRVDLPELLKFVDLENIERKAALPDNGTYSASFSLDKVEGLPKQKTFGRQIFCMKQNRAIVPHGHDNMCTGFIVLKGEFRGRHYDRLETADDHYIIKATIDEEFKAGGVSTISDHKDNVHWFHCTSETGYIFNAHVIGYDPAISAPSGRIYLDPDGKKLADGLIKAPKMNSEDCHKKYG